MRLLEKNAGSALLACLIVVATLSTVTASLMLLNLSHKKEVAGVGQRSRALYLAETGLNESLLQLAVSLEQGTTIPTSIGTPEAPTRVKGGRYWVSITDNADGSYSVISSGESNLTQRSLRGVIEPVRTVFDHSIFAGNRSRDPNYALTLGGSGAQADLITGDIYSAGDVEITGDASVTGFINSGGVIVGGAGNENVRRTLPDVVRMDYANNNDFDVATLFGTATWEASDLGGSAWQVSEDSPAHIFRKNPDDRVLETAATIKDDYFLEDPHEAVTDFTDALSGGDGHSITLSGIMGHPGVSGTDKVYFIDGNLWVHNSKFLRLRLYNTDAEGATVTFVVKGNVYFSDDVLTEDPVNDAIAFIALEDDAEPDSGNIYFGDPRFGTLDRMEAFLYAENDFYDNNLNDDGSQVVTIEGNMTAGNHVAINRDAVDDNGDVQHSSLRVEFDDRISLGTLDLPGLPQSVYGIEGYTIAFWREIPPQ